MQIIPAVDVLDGQAVRLEQGRFDRATVYHDDPGAVLRSFAEQGAGLVHVVDLGAARSGVRSPGLIDSLAAGGVRFQIGGGIRGVDDAEEAVASGAHRVVVGSTAVWDPGRLAAIVDAVGGERVVAALDVAGGRARGSGWEDEGRPVLEVAADAARCGVGRVLVTAVSRDGMMTGPDTRLLEAVAGAIEIPVIASGGVGSLAHLQGLTETPVEAAIVGRALYEGRFTLAEAIAAGQGR